MCTYTIYTDNPKWLHMQHYGVYLSAELTTPGANSYSVKEGLTRKGVGGGPAHSLKGRPSPFVYNGFSNSAMYKCSTLV